MFIYQLIIVIFIIIYDITTGKKKTIHNKSIFKLQTTYVQTVKLC